MDRTDLSAHLLQWNDSTHSKEQGGSRPEQKRRSALKNTEIKTDTVV